MGAQGTAIVDFGAYPGSPDASVAVAGQAAILTTSAAEAWLRPQDATAENSVDMHIMASNMMEVIAGPITAADGFPIRCISRDGTNFVGTFNLNWVWNGP